MFPGKVLPTSTASHQPQSAGSVVFKVHEKCDAACSRDLDSDRVFAEPSLA